jgi:Na+/phosphate symporter
MKQTKPTLSHRASQQLAEVQTEMTAAAQELKDYTFTQKAAFVKKMQGQMAEINRDLEHISASIEKSSASVKAKAQPKNQALRDQTAKLHHQLDAVIAATESTWDDVKASSRTASNELKDGLQHARQWVSDKIAP